MESVLGHLGYDEIVNFIEPQARVLDVGCGQGDLLKRLIEEKRVRGTGIDIDQDNVVACVQKGIPVIHEDINQGLANYKDNSYDYVILSQTLQVTQRPDEVLKEMLRVGKKGIVSFPNFGHWPLRFQLVARGLMPKNAALEYEWYNTPNIHLCTVDDFKQFCSKEKIHILKAILLRGAGEKVRRFKMLSNLLTEIAVFVLEKK